MRINKSIPEMTHLSGSLLGKLAMKLKENKLNVLRLTQITSRKNLTLSYLGSLRQIFNNVRVGVANNL